MNDGDVFAGVSGLAEQSLLAMSMLAVSLGLQWMAVRRPSPVFAKGTLLLGALGMAMALVGLAVVHNPMNTGEPVDGGAFDGTLLLGYLLPALMSFAVAALAARRPTARSGTSGPPARSAASSPSCGRRLPSAPPGTSAISRDRRWRTANSTPIRPSGSPSA